ncbi:hypothetical protein [Roseicella aquatilis]|uniref:Uncharacterized protein n=1 Tax=Roseicella aquatilis TaxID=2527868 RepID=A0A4R4DBF7_9PROT|nr:hypothetical protein [Roseicella aquatilis]TCZ57817.1 hypothetical protein EXY23_17800 [Roseicella aquatilis]
MRFLAAPLFPAAPQAAPSRQAAAEPDWPLLDALTRPAEPPVAEPPRGTLARLLAGLGPTPIAAPPTPVAAPPARPAWTVPAPAAPAAVPAARVPVPLSDVFQTLARGVAANPSFAALRQSGGGAGAR